jgi:alpha-1,2-mannosyltransferase
MVSRSARWASIGAWTISLAILALGALHKARRANGNDFTAYLDAAEALLAGRSPYTLNATFPYVYPLFLGLVLGPLTAVPRDVATVVWFLLSVASLAAAAWIVVRLARDARILPPSTPLTVPLVALWFLLFDPIQSELLNGQVNFVVLLLCVLCLRWLRGQARLGSGGSLAAAIAIKVNPALLLGFLGVRREGAVILVCLVVTAAFVAGPLLLLPAGGGYGVYLQSFILARLGAEISTHRNVRFSVNGALETLVPGWSGALWRRAAGAMLPLAGLALVELLSRRRAGRPREVWVFALYLLSLPLVTPISEVHHLAYAFPALGLLALASVSEWLASGSRRPLVGVTVTCLLLLGGRMARAGPWFFLALCLLFGLVAAQVLGGRLRASDDQVDPRDVGTIRPRCGA